MPTLTHALSVQQPWASALIVAGPNRKPLENRYSVAAIDRPPFPVPVGWMGIHASLTIHELADACLALCPEVAPPPLWPRGALIGAVHVTGWMRAQEALQRPDLARWVIRPSADDIAAEAARRGRAVAPDGWCLVTDAAVTLPAPIPMRGMLGLWALAHEVTIG